jgi:Ni,Fe-hydrogenase III large subunit
MTTLRGLADRLGLAIDESAPHELRARCAPEEFLGAATTLAAQAVLADLFATTGSGQPSLIVVFEVTGDPEWLLLRTQLTGDSFPSLTPATHVASWYEREIHEMHGVQPVGHPALARLRLHDWPVGQPPMRAALDRRLDIGPGVPSLVPIVHGQGVFQLPLGPVRSGPQESGEFLFNSGGEDLVAVSQLLGFKLRVVERLAEGRTVDQALMLAERLAGVSTFSNALAFVQAVERASAITVGERSRAARTLMNELERLHNHFGDISRLADATGLMIAGAQYASLKEDVLRRCAELTKHRYLRGILAVGGLQAPLPDAALESLRQRLPEWLRRSARLERLLEETAIFIDRVETTGVLTPEYAAPHNLVGPTGRSTGADRDCRRDHPYAWYDQVTFEILVKSQGDALARLSIRLFEIRQSIRIMEQVLEAWPVSDVAAPSDSPATGEALGWSEGGGGETLHWVKLTGDGRVARWRARPPAFVNWHPYAEACASGNNLTDYPVIEASFGLSHAEFDR